MPASKYLKNKVADFLWRAQAFAPPATVYAALLTVAPTAADVYTELAAAGYARIAVAESLAAWSGTQGAGTTAVSSGSSAIAESSNNAAVAFHAALTANWSGLVVLAFFDASPLTTGNLLDWYYLTDSAGTPVTRNYAIGDPVSFAISSIKRRLANG